MIRIESISIKEFRGIRNLTLNFKRNNFAICGPNGTGKSGVVDALEFALTGNVSRLSGEGRGDISLKTHGPHVDSRNAPEKAQVTITVTIPSLSKTVTIERTVKAPAVAKVTPSDGPILSVLKQVESHPEIVLSRRELIKYVLATPGDRAKEVQALLHLDQVEQVRSGLQKIANACERDVKTQETDAETASENLLKALGISTLTRDKVLAATNAQRTILSLPPLGDLTNTTSLKDGLATAGQGQAQRIAKKQALEDIKAARDILGKLTSPETGTLVAESRNELNAIENDPTLASGVTLENFYTTGLTLASEGVCPLCDTSWDLKTLTKHVRAKIDHLKEVSRKRKLAEDRLSPLIALLRKVQSSLNLLVRHGDDARPPLVVNAIKEHSAACAASISTFGAFLPIGNTITVLASLTSIPKAVYDDILGFEKLVAALPEPSLLDAAREWLTVAQERMEQYRTAKRKHKIALEQAIRARRVSDLYGTASNGVLTGIFAKVQDDFSALYRAINRDDEDKFAAKLIPSMGKLGFDVDFYGRGFFPPGAYHSEGHQDGMGLCLYLSLMRHLQGAGFTFAILDDVLMSVDTGHRREVCALLKKEFPDTQFVMTTHDPIWLRHMKTEKLIGGKSAVQFRMWDVEHGPTEWDDRDVWTEIDDSLKRNYVRSAAALLRHYLEYVSAELCHRLRAPVEFRGDAQYQLGELLPAAVKHMRRMLTQAKSAANSWGQKDRVDEIGALEAKFHALTESSQAEQWQTNVAIHFNEWENLGPDDFAPVAKSQRALLDGFTCPHCSEFLRITPERETHDAVRCDCGRTILNLKPKPRDAQLKSEPAQGA